MLLVQAERSDNEPSPYTYAPGGSMVLAHTASSSDLAGAPHTILKHAGKSPGADESAPIPSYPSDPSNDEGKYRQECSSHGGTTLVNACRSYMALV